MSCVIGVIEILVSKMPLLNFDIFWLEFLVVLTIEYVLDNPRSRLVLILRWILHQCCKFHVCALVQMVSLQGGDHFHWSQSNSRVPELQSPQRTSLIQGQNKWHVHHDVLGVQMKGACSFECKSRSFVGCGSCEEIVSLAVVLTLTFAREVLVTTDAKDKLLTGHVARAYRTE